MKGDPKVIVALCGLLKSEFQAMAQYRLQSQVLRNKGYKSLKHKLHGFFYEENDHSKKVLNRILFLGGEAEPQDAIPPEPAVGDNVLAMFNFDLILENQAIVLYNQAARLAFNANDMGTAHLLHKIIVEEEDHAFWLEKQLSVIRDLGEQEYLSTKA